MSKLKLAHYLLVMLAITTLASCDKDDDAEPSNKGHLTSKAWKGAKITLNESNFTQYFADEVGYDIKNNTITYKGDGTYSDTYGRTTTSGNWEFALNETELVYDKGTEDEFTMQISKLNKDSLIISQTQYIDGDKVTLKLHYGH